LFVAQTIFEIRLFFLKSGLPGIQLIEGSTIFGTSFNVSCSRVVSFESKLTLNPSGSVQQFRERRRICSDDKSFKESSTFLFFSTDDLLADVEF